MHSGDSKRTAFRWQRAGAESEHSYAASERSALASLDAAEAAVALAIDEYATSAHRPIPALEMPDAALSEQPTTGVDIDEVIEFVPQEEFAAEPAYQSPSADFSPATEPIELVRRGEHLDAYRASGSRLVTRQSAAGRSFLLLAAASEAARRGFSAASLAITLAELELGEVLLVGP